ncbi:MAG: bacillithiol biosynthesis deacetylase BshB1 [Planctomycetes bacterium]|nr:bacillithiol biosynthesis deacetylase BshB1 [Planctomycetota bacterium]
MADVLVFSPHPDDAEINCGATIARHARLGATVALVDATRGELGSRGTADERAREAAEAGAVLGLASRENLGLRDGHLQRDDLGARSAIVDAIRRHRPGVVLCLHGHARHPDHQALAVLVGSAIKAAALHQLSTPSGAPAVAGARLWFYEAELRIAPDFLVPASDEDWARKMAAIRCYASQLHQAGPGLPETTIARPDFLAHVELRGRTWGREAGAPYAEAFARCHDTPRMADLRDA